MFQGICKRNILSDFNTTTENQLTLSIERKIVLYMCSNLSIFKTLCISSYTFYRMFQKMLFMLLFYLSECLAVLIFFIRYVYMEFATVTFCLFISLFWNFISILYYVFGKDFDQTMNIFEIYFYSLISLKQHS